MNVFIIINCLSIWCPLYKGQINVYIIFLFRNGFHLYPFRTCYSTVTITGIILFILLCSDIFLSVVCFKYLIFTIIFTIMNICYTWLTILKIPIITILYICYNILNQIDQRDIEVVDYVQQCRRFPGPTLIYRWNSATSFVIQDHYIDLDYWTFNLFAAYFWMVILCPRRQWHEVVTKPSSYVSFYLLLLYKRRQMWLNRIKNFIF